MAEDESSAWQRGQFTAADCSTEPVKRDKNAPRRKELLPAGYVACYTQCARMDKKMSLSFSGTAILQAVAHSYHYGFDIMDVTGLPSGTVYPALRRLEAAGLLAAKWEDEQTARNEQRPARKYYKLTATGRKALAEAVGRYRRLEGVLARKEGPSRA